jgi:hypothetical protein
LTKDSNVAVGAGSIVNVHVVGDVADGLHDQGCGDSAPEAMPRGAVGFKVGPGTYSPLSIAAMPPVSLVGLSWAMDPDRRLAAALTHVPLNGRLTNSVTVSLIDPFCSRRDLLGFSGPA